MGERNDPDGEGEGDGERFRCRVCGREFESETALHEHVENAGLLK